MKLDLRLALPVAVAWGIVGVLIGLPFLLSGAAIFLWTLALISIVCARLSAQRRRAVLLGIAIAAASAGLMVTIAATLEPERRPSWLVAAAESGRYVTATADTSQMVPGAMRTGAPFAAVLTSVTQGGKTRSVRIPVAVFADTHTIAGAGIGTTISLAGSLAPADAGDDLAFTFFVSGDVVELRGAPWYLDWANGLRTSFRSAASLLPGEGGDLLPGLSIGDTSAVSESLDTAMKATSLSHLTAVSGANCAVVIALIMLAGGALRISRTWRILSSMAVLLGFVVLVTPEPSVLRAAVMATLVLAAMLRGRVIRGVPTLALAVLLLLVIDPWLARSYGFILSVLATGGLLVLSGPLARTLSRWLPDWLAAIIAIPLAAQLACQPVLILLNPSIPTFGVLANVLAGPAAPVATVLGLIACLLIPFVPPVGMLVAQIGWVPAAWIAGVASFFASLPGNKVPWPPGAFGVGAALTVITLLLLATLRQPGHTRRASSICLCLVLVCYLGIAAGQRAQSHFSRPAGWQIAACDVGQGDAVIVRSRGNVALIDTGEDADLLTTCLKKLGIRHIDLLVLSHWDIDHVGAAPAVFGRVTRAIFGPSDGSEAAGIAGQLEESGAVTDQVQRGDSGTLGDLGWQVLWPPERLGGVEPGNDASVVIRFEGLGPCAGGCLSALFLGDLGRIPQFRLMGANRVDQTDVVKVAHHGSGDQNEALYRRVRAAVGLVSVGADNDYGHPTDFLLELLAEIGTMAARTDHEGMILLSPTPDGRVDVYSERLSDRGAP